jgi:hypothetical protein
LLKRHEHREKMEHRILGLPRKEISFQERRECIPCERGTELLSWT